MTAREALPPSGNGIYKTISMCLASALISMVGAYFLAARNMVSKEELPALIQQNNPYTADAKDIGSKLVALREQEAKDHAEVIERIILLDAYQKQIGQDVANIAAKAGVTAHPITDSKGSRNKP